MRTIAETTAFPSLSPVRSGPAMPLSRRRTVTSALRMCWMLLGLCLLFAGLPPSVFAASEPAPGTDPVVVTSVAPITDLVKQVAAGRAEVVQLIPSGVSSHGFEPTPRQMATLERADLLVLNGAGLEPGIERMADHVLPPGTPIIRLADETIPQQEWVVEPVYGEQANPHFWLDVSYARGYAKAISEALSAVNPSASPHYEAAWERFDARLAALDEAALAAIATIPSEHRKLVAYHDCCPYLARRYDLAWVGAVQPADFSRPSPREVAAIIEQIKSEAVPAVFGSAAFPSRVLAQIAQEAEATFIDGLEDDVLPGQPGEDEHTYIGMMLANLRLIVEGLGGDVTGLRLP